MKFLSYLIMVFFVLNSYAKENVFFKEYMAEFKKEMNNCTNKRLRVNDTDASLDHKYGSRGEVQSNGLMLIRMPENCFYIDKTELLLELWGGHPGTEQKRFSLNGKMSYDLPEHGTQIGHCVYSYPRIMTRISHLVNGVNAFLFSCDKPNGWGHYIIDHASLRVNFSTKHPDITRLDLKHFNPKLFISDSPTQLDNSVELSLACSAEEQSKIDSVCYFAHYLDFDDDGDGRFYDWHGYTVQGAYDNHLGTSSTAPFTIAWDTQMIPDQTRPISFKALVYLKSGYRCYIEDNNKYFLNNTRRPVHLISCSSCPVPFWSRASHEKKAYIFIPANGKVIDKAMLVVKMWYTQIEDSHYYFQMNGHDYQLIPHENQKKPLLRKIDISPDDLNVGENEITLFCDTPHHGIEILLPGPCLLLRYKK